MSLIGLVAAGVLVAASLAFVIIGAVYHWDMTSDGYALWTRVVGVIAVLALAGVAAWGRIMQPLVAVAIMLGGIALAVGYVIAHKRLTERVRAQLGGGSGSA